MAAFISEALLQDQECRLPARKRGDAQLLGTGGSPHFSRASQALWELPTTRDATSYNHHEGWAQLHPQAPGEAPTHVLLFLHLSRAPHTNLSTLRRQDFKEEEETSFFWEVCFHRPLNSVHRGFFHLWYFVFHSYSFLRHRALADIKCLVCPEWPLYTSKFQIYSYFKNFIQVSM